MYIFCCEHNIHLNSIKHCEYFLAILDEFLDLDGAIYLNLE